MKSAHTSKSAAPRQGPGFFAIFPILGKLIWTAIKRLANVQTLVALEKKQGAGSGERTVEDELLEQALQRNPHNYHIPTAEKSGSGTEHARRTELDRPVLIVRKGGPDERAR